MRTLSSFIIVLMVMVLPGRAENFTCNGSVDVFFSPDGGATAAIVQELKRSRSEVLVQAYSFTSQPIAKALLDAKRRGVNVEAILDKTNATAKYSAARFLANSGIPVWIDSAHAIAHNKLLIIDRGIVVTGSFNFTKAAESKNAENLIILQCKQPITDSYVRNYFHHKRHSSPFHRMERR